MPTTQVCQRCKAHRPLDDFPLLESRTRGGRQRRSGTCAPCSENVYEAMSVSIDLGPPLWDWDAAERTCVECDRALPRDAFPPRGSLRTFRTSPYFTCLGCAALAARVRAYGISVKDFWELVRLQEGACAICSTCPEDPTALHIDHNHATGEVRGLLCGGCNTGIGHLGDDADRIARAAEYVRANGTKPSFRVLTTR